MQKKYLSIRILNGSSRQDVLQQLKNGNGNFDETDPLCDMVIGTDKKSIAKLIKLIEQGKTKKQQ